MKVLDQVITDNYSIYCGDCCEIVKNIPSESVGYTIMSPPFAELYCYSNSERDMGNAKNYQEFFEHFRDYLIPELFRITKQGRSVSFHCMNIPAMKERDGYIGIKDFRGDLIRCFQAAGFIYHSEVCIWKDPLIEATRTKALGLMHKQLIKDSYICRQGLPDYVVTMRKPGKNMKEDYINHPDGLTSYAGSNPPIDDGTIKYSHYIWQKYASPVWMDIRQTYTLNKGHAREEKDEKHICPLQLDTVQRCIDLWSKKGDTVLTPFMGIGTEVLKAVEMGRKGIGIELKESYFGESVKNLKDIEPAQSNQYKLF